MSRRVRPADISVVVQGPVIGVREGPHAARLTLRALESVRRHLPGAEVVLSTWEGADVADLPFDHVLLSRDPGSDRYDDGSFERPAMYTGNRQIVSTLAGLRTASRPYAMKLRSDMMLTGTGFLGLVGRYPRRTDECRVFAERVLVPSYFSCNPASERHYPFHPSDWWQFGRREDLLELWDIPFAGPEVAQWFAGRPQPPLEVETRLLARYYVEQWIWVSCLRKHGPLPFEHKCDCNPAALRLSELSFANNLVFASLEELGLRFLKGTVGLRVWEHIYSRTEWEQLYQRHCDPAFRPSFDLRRALLRAYRASCSPGSWRLARRITDPWRRLSPRSFDAARAAYAAAHGLIRRRAPW